MSEPIFFSSKNGKYGFMSNFYGTKFVSGSGIVFDSSEKYFMYIKARTFEPKNDKLLKSIIEAKTPADAKKLGRKVKNFDGELWDVVGYKAMKRAIRYKFNQNKDLKARLKDTGDAILYEAAPWDKKWGIGYSKADALKIDPSKYGTNLLGLLLMEYRSKL